MTYDEWLIDDDLFNENVAKPILPTRAEYDALRIMISAAEKCANMDHLLTEAIELCDKMAKRMRKDGGNR